MRFYDIALYVFIFNLVLGFLNVAIDQYTAASISGADYFGESEMDTAEESITSRINEVYTPIFSELNWLVENVRLAIQGVSTFIIWMGKSTIFFPLLWYELGAPYFGADWAVWAAFVTLISLPFYFVYTMGIIQWAAGRSVKEAG